MRFTTLALLALAAGSLTALRAQQTTGRMPNVAPVEPTTTEAEVGALTRPRMRTLFAEDFIRHAMSLKTGRYGLAVQDNVVVNVDSELDFDVYNADQFTAGVQGGQVGELLDLGTFDDLALRYGYQETVGGGQGFSSIRYEGGTMVILADLSTAEVQPFPEAQAFLDAPLSSTSIPAPVQAGHVYLVRLQDRNDPTFLRFAKLLVNEHVPGVRVTLAWEEIVVE